MNTELQEQDLHRLVEQFKNSIELYKDSSENNEQECRDEFISPLLECFGWDVSNKQGKLPQYKDVVVEKFSNVRDRPDYTLTLNGLSKLFVEVKKPSVDITKDKDPALQARRYGWNAGHKIVLLTNFEYLCVYDCTIKISKSDTVNTGLYRKYYYEDFEAKFPEIYELISQENVYNGKFDEFLKENFQANNRYTQELDETFLEMLNLWRVKIGEYLYNTDEKYQNLEQLNDVVQDFINQVIFLRICEDRNLPLYKKLYDTVEDQNELKEELTKLMKEADKRYNSGLFSGTDIIFDLDNVIILDMILSLYYPLSSFMFDIIESSLLGKVYEQFLTKKLAIIDENLKLVDKKEYEDRFIVTTPVHIVKYMVKEALEVKCSNKTPEQILRIKIADIACGSGVFLEEAFQFLQDYCMNWYLNNNEPSHLIELGNGKYKLPLEDKKNILLNCIFGVDIDAHAVQVCKFSLLIKLIEDETNPSVKNVTPILPNLDDNILTGNSLIEREDIQSSDLGLLKRIRPFNWNTINNGELFDIILGNPPYVKTEDLHLLETEEEISIYKQKYKNVVRKQFDKYFLFIEKAIKLLNPEGVLEYIVPNKFWKIDAGEKLRVYLSKKIAKIDDFGSLQLFSSKTIYSSIIKCINKTEDCEYAVVDKNPETLWAGKVSNYSIIPNSSLSEKPWLLLSDLSLMKLMDRIKNRCVELGSVVDIFNGIQTSAEQPPVYWFGADEIETETSSSYVINKFGKRYEIEKGILKPYFKPTKQSQKGLTTYSFFETDKKIIFPYEEDGKLISIEKMKQEYAGIFKYLEDRYELLKPKTLGGKRDVKDANSSNWYQYGRTQALTSFINVPKLIVKVLVTTYPMYIYDENDTLIASGGTAGYVAISNEKKSKYHLFYIQAWLDSPITENIIRAMGSDFEGDAVARGTYLLPVLPFVDLDFSDKKQKTIYDKILENTRVINEINQQLGKADKATLKTLLSEKERLILSNHSLIEKVYNFNF